MPVFYDGWSLAYQPNSPAALHLLTILQLHSRQYSVVVAAPAASFHVLPKQVTVKIHPTPDTALGRLRWEQRRLPLLARQAGAECIHLLSGGPALFSRTGNLFSPASYDFERLFHIAELQPLGLAGRLRDAFAQGGLSRVQGVLWPADLPTPELGLPLLECPPLAPIYGLIDDRRSQDDGQAYVGELDLPETYVLYHGPTTRLDLERLLDAWRWAAGVIGEYTPLLLAGLDEKAGGYLAGLLERDGLAGGVRILPPLTAPALAALYQGCSAVFHPAPISPWGGSLRLALAYAKPIVALDTPMAAALVGPAAYLVGAGLPQPEISRALGGALLSVIVDEGMAAALSLAAHERSADWKKEAFLSGLLAACQAVK